MKKDRQNVTVSLPKELVTIAKHAAVDRGLSLSSFLAEVLTEALGRQAAYEQAKQRQLRLLQAGFDLGTRGQVTWSREELHAR